ncbi:MAG: cytochrome c biogenesis protein CcsA [Alphaproteobacteria bacterium]
MTAETAVTILGMAFYLAAAGTTVLLEVWRERSPSLSIGLVLAGQLVHGIGIGLRWERLGHGPYVNLYEILSSSIHTLHTAVILAVLVVPRLKPMLVVLLPLLTPMVLWFLLVPPADSLVPVTYATVWLPVHVWLGKIFMGIMFIAVGGSTVILLRWWFGGGLFPMLPRSEAIDDIDTRLVLLAFVFDCAMLVAGAAWAQDAWGRYWSWDPLETWSFLTWLAVATFLHLRLAMRLRPHVPAMVLIAVFFLAYYTFFGMPFVSTSAHKGIF